MKTPRRNAASTKQFVNAKAHSEGGEGARWFWDRMLLGLLCLMEVLPVLWETPPTGWDGEFSPLRGCTGTSWGPFS